jgi:hypothetical protein
VVEARVTILEKTAHLPPCPFIGTHLEDIKILDEANKKKKETASSRMWDILKPTLIHIIISLATVLLTLLGLGQL